MTGEPQAGPGDAAVTVMSAMREASALGILYSAAVARALGISSSDLECLDVIAAHQPVTAGALAGATGLTTGAITGVVDRLEQAGFVRRTRPEADRRKVLVSTTDAFLAEVVPLFDPMRRLQSAVVERHSAEQLRTVADFMTLSLQAAREAIVEIGRRSGPERPQDRSRR